MGYKIQSLFSFLKFLENMNFSRKSFFFSLISIFPFLSFKSLRKKWVAEIGGLERREENNCSSPAPSDRGLGISWPVFVSRAKGQSGPHLSSTLNLMIQLSFSNFSNPQYFHLLFLHLLSCLFILFIA